MGVERSLWWQDILRGAKAGLVGEGNADISFSGTFKACPPTNVSGNFEACANSVTVTLGAYGMVWAGAAGYQAGGYVAGQAQVTMSVCMNVDMNSGAISGLHSEK